MNHGHSQKLITLLVTSEKQLNKPSRYTRITGGHGFLKKNNLMHFRVLVPKSTGNLVAGFLGTLGPCSPPTRHVNGSENEQLMINYVHAAKYLYH